MTKKDITFILRNVIVATIGLAVTFAVNRYEEPLRGCCTIGGEMFIAPVMVLCAECIAEWFGKVRGDNV